MRRSSSGPNEIFSDKKKITEWVSTLPSQKTNITRKKRTRKKRRIENEKINKHKEP